MAVYKFKVWFEDNEDVVRVIEVKSTQTFLDLHNAIQDSVGFDKSQLASFYVSDDQWKKGLEITLEQMGDEDDDEAPLLIMKQTRLCDVINDPHQKFVYIFDFIEMWTFCVELTGINIKEDPKAKYPVCIKSTGMSPKQYDKVARFGFVEDNEFDEITKNYLLKSDDLPTGIAESDDDEQGAAAEDDEFGSEELGLDDEDSRF